MNAICEQEEQQKARQATPGSDAGRVGPCWTAKIVAVAIVAVAALTIAGPAYADNVTREHRLAAAATRRVTLDVKSLAGLPFGLDCPGAGFNEFDADISLGRHPYSTGPTVRDHQEMGEVYDWVDYANTLQVVGTYSGLWAIGEIHVEEDDSWICGGDDTVDLHPNANVTGGVKVYVHLESGEVYLENGAHDRLIGSANGSTITLTAYGTNSQPGVQTSFRMTLT
jgi:hypothetical protein